MRLHVAASLTSVTRLNSHEQGNIEQPHAHALAALRAPPEMLHVLLRAAGRP